MEESLTLLQEAIESYTGFLSQNPVIRDVSEKEIKQRLQQYDFAEPVQLSSVTSDVIDMFSKWSMHVAHPGYLGLYNPAPSKASVIADALVALYNPQLAVWTHAPIANEVEKHVLQFIGHKIGYAKGEFFASFTSGGSEANHTGILAAMATLFPEYLEEGLSAIKKRPVVYMSEAAHNSFDKIVKNTGLGTNALTKIRIDSSLKMDVQALKVAITRDIAEGRQPAILIGTAGTTASGTIDPLLELSNLARKYNLWFHIDAAWAGAAVISPKLRRYLAGIELADSITIDAHKWFSVSMGAGMFFTRHPQAIQAAFNIPASYMPSALQTEPYVTTLQWSRRCIGLKLFMSLAEKGEKGMANQIERQCELTNYLKQELITSGWQIVNDSTVGVANFTHPNILNKDITAEQVQKQLQQEGDFWISTVPVAGYGKVLRACVGSAHTTEEHIEHLISRLNELVNNIRVAEQVSLV